MSKQFKVLMTVTVDKIVTCEGCTADEARAKPWEYAIDEQETDMRDWQVNKVEECE